MRSDTSVSCLRWRGMPTGPAASARTGDGRPLIYALSLAVYCTSWTFFGSVGLAASTGYDFIPVYLGPILLFVFGWRFLLRIVRLAKSQNITSVADFLAARYGKSQAVAAIVTVIAVAGTLPYIALQLKAVALSVDTLLGARPLQQLNLPTDTAFIIALTMATFAVLFGTRHIDATEHQEGLIVAVAAESLVKLAAFLTVGFFVIFSVFGGVGGLLERVQQSAEIQRIFAEGFNGGLLDHGDVPQPRVHRPAAAPVPRDRGREQLGEGDPPRRLAVPGLPGADQPVRDADRRGRPAQPAQGLLRCRHLRAGPAAVGGGRGHNAAGVRRRSVGRHRHGDRRFRGAGDHGLQRPGAAAAAAPARCTSPRASRRTWRGCCWPSAASPSSPSSCWAICSTGCWGRRMAWPPSASSRSPPSPSSRRRSSAA